MVGEIGFVFTFYSKVLGLQVVSNEVKHYRNTTYRNTTYRNTTYRNTTYRNR